ncbi:CRE-CHE-1 protein [Caenorhabditis remanei]|uniref:CRE-CHE-1 protein n=2 Tax=Caenorhabditis remanei TaxID=31234 RepID=E3MVT6_CAERE|nr:CRE-CHE-1 protein [Caenorhabditis remanei]
MSYHYQMNTNNNDFFDSTNYIPQMQMHHGYQEFYSTDATSSMMTSAATSQVPQPTENSGIMVVQSSGGGGGVGTEHGGYGGVGWRQHDWNSTSSWTMGNQMGDHMGTGTVGITGTQISSLNHATSHIRATVQPVEYKPMMTASHVVADTFRSTQPCYMNPPPTRMLSAVKKPPATVHRPLARSTPKPFRCQTCGKAFSQAANLTAHKRIHTGEKPFMCPVCNRPFSQSSSLVTHRRTHTGERPYPCAQCEKAFTDSSTLTKHLRTHTGHKPYVCSICMMKFTQSGNLHRHMKTHK